MARPMMALKPMMASIGAISQAARFETEPTREMVARASRNRAEQTRLNCSESSGGVTKGRAT
ncbi:hypothetical protein D3C72_2494160 [compost metagenome]